MQKSFKFLFLIAVLVVSLIITPVMPAKALSLPAQMNKSFNPISIVAGGTSILSVTIYNPNSFPLTAAHYHDIFPAGIRLANPVNVTLSDNNLTDTHCGSSSTVTDNANDPLPGNPLAPGGTMFRLDGGTVPAQVGSTPGSCTVTVVVTSTTPGNLINNIPANELTSSGLDGINPVSITNTSAASATLQVGAVAAPTVTKSFNPTPIMAGQASQLAIVVTNHDLNIALTQATLTDYLPTNVVLSTPLTTSLAGCGSATLTDSSGNALAAGSNSVKLNNATVAANSTCTIHVNVTSLTGGIYSNTIQAGPGGLGSLQTQQGVTNSTPSTASLTVQQTVSLIKSFSPATILAGGTSTLTITLRNPTGSDYTGVSVSDTLPAPLLINGTPTTTCGVSASLATAPALSPNQVSLSGGTIPKSAAPPAFNTCTITVPVIAPLNSPAATYTNTIPVGVGGLTTAQGISNTTAATANITVQSATITKAFAPTSFPDGGTSVMTITINNPTASILHGASISDTLPSPLTISGAQSAAGTCTGASGNSFANGATGLSFSGLTLPAAGSCTLTVTVTAPLSASAQTVTNTIPAGNLSTTEGVTNASLATANVSVRSVSVIKAFSAPITAGGTTTLTITLQNPTGSPYTVASFSDTLPSPLTVVDGSATTDCPGGIGHASTTLPRTVSLSGGTIPPSATPPTPVGFCHLTVTVLAPISAGNTYTNTINAGDLKTVEGAQNSTTATANLTVQPAVAVSKGFLSASFPTGGTDTLAITLLNQTSTDLTNVNISDILPATPNTNLTVKLGTAATTCINASNTQTASTTAPRTVSLSGGAIPANSSCTITVDVTVPSGSPTATYNNSINANALSSAQGASSSSASASVTADASNPPTVTKTFLPTTIAAGANTRLRITVTAPSDTSLTAFSINDSLPTGMTVSNVNAGGTPTNPAKNGSCSGGTLTATTGSTSITWTGGTINASATCQITVYVTSSTAGLNTNSIQPSDISSTPNRPIAAPVTANLTVSSLSASKAFNVATVGPNGIAILTITLTNTSVSPLTNASVTDNLPGTTTNGLVVAAVSPPTVLAPATTCGSGAITAVAGTQAISMTGGTINPNSSCTVTIYIQGKGAVTVNPYNNTIQNANVGASAQGTIIHPTQAQPASASLAIASLGIAVVKGFNPTIVYGGSASTLSVQLTNPNNTPLTGITFTDIMLDSVLHTDSIFIANPANFSVGTCGGTLTGAPGTNSFTFSGGALAANATCTVTLSTTMNVNGNLTNAIGVGDVTSANGASNTQLTTASLTNLAGASVTKLFTPGSIFAGGGSSYSLLTITIKNTYSTTLTGMGLTDNLPANSLTDYLAVAGSPAPAPVNNCGGTLTATPGTQVIQLAGGTLATASNCTIVVPVMGTLVGSYQNCIPQFALSNDQNQQNQAATCDTLAVISPATISGTIYNDLSGNGSFDSGEPGLPGVTVNLYADDGTGHPTGTVIATTTTDSNGAYSFTDLPAGNYVVQETDLPNYASTGDTAGANDNLIPVALAAGATSTGNDFFDWLTNGSISGTVYDDLNGNGLFDSGEPGLTGVTVTLYADDNTGHPTGAAIATTTTDGSGAYSFPSLLAGKYVVEETDLPNYTSTGDTAGANDNLIPVALAAGANSTGNDFFDWQTNASISGTVYNDQNGNGSFDSGEPGLTGVTVTLYADDNTGHPSGAAIATTTTDGSGAYSFMNLPAGNYVVEETDLAGFTSTGDIAGANDNLIPVALAAGVNSTANDFFDQQLNAVIDPPAGYKTFSETGFPQLEFRLVWINNANSNQTPAIHVQVTDNIPTGTTYVKGSLTCSPQGTTSSTDSGSASDPLNTALSTCDYDSTANSGGGGIQWQGQIAPDFNVDQNTAVNAVIITFRVTVNDGVNQVLNQASSRTDVNPSDINGVFTSALQTDVVPTNQVVWNRSGSGIGSPKTLPGTGFAPGTQTLLPVQPADKAYSSYGDVWLEIPSLGVKMPIVGVPRLENSWDVSWLANQAGWLESTAFPSWVGNSVLTGHVYMANGQPGPFVNLSKLRWGDQIIAHVYGVRYVYEVRDNRVLSPTDTSVLGHKNDPWMTLLTCKDFDASSNMYAHRVAISAVYVNSQVEQGR